MGNTRVTPKPWSMKERIHEVDFTEIRTFCLVRDTVKRMKRQTTDGQKTFANDTSDKGLLCKNIKNTQNSTIRKQYVLKRGPRP